MDYIISTCINLCCTCINHACIGYDYDLKWLMSNSIAAGDNCGSTCGDVFLIHCYLYYIITNEKLSIPN